MKEGILVQIFRMAYLTYIEVVKIYNPRVYIFQVLNSHPNYPKIRKEILDKARQSIRV